LNYLSKLLNKFYDKKRHLASSGVDVYSAIAGSCAALYGIILNCKFNLIFIKFKLNFFLLK
jgi:hypothetical protein